MKLWTDHRLENGLGPTGGQPRSELDRSKNEELEAFQPISEAEAVSKANLVQAEELFTISQRINELFMIAKPFLNEGASSSQWRSFRILGLRLKTKFLRLGPAVTISDNGEPPK